MMDLIISKQPLDSNGTNSAQEMIVDLIFSKLILYSNNSQDGLFVALFFVSIFLIWLGYNYLMDYFYLRKKQKEALKEKPKLQKEILELEKKNNSKNMIIENNTHRISQLEKAIQKKDDLYSSLVSLNNFSLANISELYSNFLTVQYDISAQYLKNKKHPAKTEAQRIADLKKETKIYIKRFKEMQYKYEALVNLFPELTNYIDDFSIIRHLNQFSDIEEVVETYDRVRDYLPKEEYETLNENERNQRALDCYNRKKKSNWQIGRDYEMYCAYQYRLMNCIIEQTGIEKKFKDLGRDLIVHKPDGSICIVQCKYWSSAKEIHENSIAQLYGTTVMYKIENNLNKSLIVKPVLITNIQLSEIAQHFANELGVLVYQSFPLKIYPQIKCNINNGNKIYHLPFDQQYDRTHIKLEGEFYAFTVKEATENGFRRAFRYYGNK